MKILGGWVLKERDVDNNYGRREGLQRVVYVRDMGAEIKVAEKRGGLGPETIVKLKERGKYRFVELS